MPDEAHAPSARKQRVDEVIAIYLEAVDAGQAPDPKRFIEEHRDVANELASFFADWKQFEQLASPLETAAGISSDKVFDDSPNRGDKGHRRDGEQASHHFGDYELLEEVARGGMGVVYKARQVSLNRVVALKMILSGQLASEEDVRRFHAEAEAAANLDHPGIVPIYEVGHHDGQQYFSMGYVDGDSLAERLRQGPMPSRQAATLLKQVCDAVQYAHDHDVVHRDLKPANILLQARGDRLETGADGNDYPPSQHALHPSVSSLQPKITDFGLAKRLNADSELTGTGQILGTPSYMPPEQAANGSNTVGPASDVYSLGAVLYQMLTGRPPFQAETPLETLTQLLDSDPLPPRLLNRSVPRELEAICMKCLEKEPPHRYPAARDLAADLQRYLDGDAIHASGINLLDRVTRALRQSRHEEHFRGWGLGLMAFGLVIFLAHVAIFAVESSGNEFWASHPWLAYFLPRSAMFAALLVMLWRFRYQSVLPTKSAERLIWAVWIGYMLALAAVNAARLVFGHDHGEVYAFSAVLAGFGFVIMGAHVWGGGYVVGAVFMIAAPLLAMYSDVASIVVGALWAGALLTFGLHYWHRGRAAHGGRSIEA